jgi:hypothetical protein
VTIAYDIEGAAKEGVVRLELKTWNMPDWRGVVQTVSYVKCPNGQTVDVGELAPGEYDVFRWIETLVLGDGGHSGMLDRGTLKVESGKAARLEYVRTKGCPISGQVAGLKEAGLPGAFIEVLPEQATGNLLFGDEWKLTVFDLLVTGQDGHFKTSRISPGTYMVTAKAYKPVPRSEDRSGITDLGGIRLPELLGKVKVVVPESGQAAPIRIEMRSDSAEEPASKPASKPANTVTVTNRVVRGEGKSQLMIRKMTGPGEAPASKPADANSGAPLTVGLSIQQSVGYITFYLTCKDASGSQVTRISNVKGEMPPPPEFMVFDSGGQQVYQATMAYG